MRHRESGNLGSWWRGGWQEGLKGLSSWVLLGTDVLEHPGSRDLRHNTSKTELVLVLPKPKLFQSPISVKSTILLMGPWICNLCHLLLAPPHPMHSIIAKSPLFSSKHFSSLFPSLQALISPPNCCNGSWPWSPSDLPHSSQTDSSDHGTAQLKKPH